MNSIPLRNTINIDPSIKREIRKLYEMIKMLLSNAKYTVLDKMELKELCKHIIIIEPKCNLNWIDTSKITNMTDLFYDINEFNGDISNWDVSKVTNMELMFASSSFNGDISNWNVSKVTNMYGMFYDCKSFNQDISN